MTIEYYDCNHEVLVDPAAVEQAFLNAAKASGATVLDSSFHAFEPQGVSGVIIIAESHFSVHCWPEHDYAAVDIFSCAETIEMQKAVDCLRDALGADEVCVSSDMNRGIVSNNGLERTIPVYEDRTHVYTLSWRRKFENSHAWGLLTSVDVYGCDANTIRDAESIKTFVHELCERIHMKRYGDCEVIQFGEDEKVSGFSMTQLIETSLISGHFADATNTSYLDIFSCKFYEPREVAEFAVSYFKGTNYRMQVALRQ
jgi:S-adenosylmethionine decarboxylase